MNPNELVKAWEQGVEDFNQGRYWHAHESWEKGWTQLQTPEKEYVQGLIQACGAFYLFIEKKRFRPAFSLVDSSLKKLRLIGPQPSESLPRTYLEIPGLETILIRLQAQSDPKLSEKWPTILWSKHVDQLRARLVK